MLNTKALTPLLRFRKGLYYNLGLRQDSLFELVDALLSTPHRSTLVRLSLCPVFRRRWPSTCDALADGSVAMPKLRTLFARTLPESASLDERSLWVIDGTNWPRVVYRAADSHQGRGRPRLHGAAFRLADADTHGQPQQSSQLAHPSYGAVRVDMWSDPHVGGAPDAPFSVVRVHVERLPNKRLPPRPLWLAWIGGPLPADLSVLWRWYLRRSWTTVRPRHPNIADRWTWLVAAACRQWWLARPLLAEVRLPWERPRADGLTTPGQVQRHFSRLLVRLGTPARVPLPRGKAPGRQPGQRPPPPQHYEVARRTPSQAAQRHGFLSNFNV